MAIDSFEAAVAAVQDIETDPGNDVKLRLYALYKQATEGDAAGSRPGIFNPVARAKFDAWAEVAGLSAADAEAEYVDLVQALVES